MIHGQCYGYGYCYSISGGDFTRDSSPCKVTKEVQISERVILEAKQILENVASEDGMEAVTTKQVQTALDKLRQGGTVCARVCKIKSSPNE